jgi:hypothetical protein
VCVFLSHFLCFAWRCFFPLVFSHIHKEKGPWRRTTTMVGGSGGVHKLVPTRCPIGTYQVPHLILFHPPQSPPLMWCGWIFSELSYKWMKQICNTTSPWMKIHNHSLSRWFMEEKKKREKLVVMFHKHNPSMVRLNHGWIEGSTKLYFLDMLKFIYLFIFEKKIVKKKWSIFFCNFLETLI